ncbi:unnamed protein product, partial [Rotaria magnacalcarata]
SFIIIRYGRRKLSEYNILVGAKDNYLKILTMHKKTNQNHTDTINELKSLQVEKKLNLLYAELVAEKCADQRDSVLAKQLLLDKKAGQILILGLHNAGKTSLLRILLDNPFDEYTYISSLSLNMKRFLVFV